MIADLAAPAGRMTGLFYLPLMKKNAFFFVVLRRRAATVAGSLTAT